MQILKQPHESQATFWPICVFAACLTTLVFYFVVYAGLPGISPDSWVIYELSKSIFSDFYSVSVTRQFEVHTDYGLSFPPLLPFLMACLNNIHDFGILAGAIVNLFAAVLSGVFLWKLGRRLYGEGAYGLLVFGLMLASPSYLGITMYGLEGTLAISLFIMAIYVSVRHVEIAGYDLVLSGLLGGASVMARFDMLLAMIAFGAFMAWRYKGAFLLGSLLYAATFFVAISPWVIFSLTHFGKPFVSDNSLAVLLAIPHFPTRYYSPGDSLPTVFAAPIAWLFSLPGKFLSSSVGFPRAIAGFAIVPLIALLAGACWLVSRSRTAGQHRQWYKAIGVPRLVPAEAAALILLITIGLTGYNDARYFLRIVLVMCLLVASAIAVGVDRQTVLPRKRIMQLMCAGIIGIQVAVCGFLSVSKGFAFSPISIAGIKAEYKPIMDAIRSAEKSPVVFVDNGFMDPYRFGAVTGIKTVVVPSNRNSCNLPQILSSYRINFILTDNRKFIRLVGASLEHKDGWPKGVWHLKQAPAPNAEICPRSREAGF